MIALLSDIHSNLQALEACLDDAANEGATRYVFLGDFVGYGADPDAVLTIVQNLCAQGAKAVKGNHDDMFSDFDHIMTANAARAANWTRNQLSLDQRAFLDNLPMTLTEDDRLYVHADASAPEKWRYVIDSSCAQYSLDACPARIIICGHVHQPALYSVNPDQKVMRFVPETDCTIPLMKSRRWHVVLPSVGQPRDENPLSGYALFNEETDEITFRRVSYDIDAAAARIRSAGLPDRLADRLYCGR